MQVKIFGNSYILVNGNVILGLGKRTPRAWVHRNANSR
jgi:hypothetical protein